MANFYGPLQTVGASEFVHNAVDVVPEASDLTYEPKSDGWLPEGSFTRGWAAARRFCSFMG
ncbi:hypothetical protein [Micromonospora sp. NPDC005413]|uniref:hypothetical protein n=1 Tax=Micromonospora sp. NPDC005413 TaxID=3154563 RepID=UPI0033BD3D2E